MLPLPNVKGKFEDVIFKMTFNATKHEIKMYNRIYVSTRALYLKGIDAQSQKEVEAWVQSIYTAYYKIRNLTVGNKNIDLSKMSDLITTYCDVLKKDDCIQDYWVTLYHNDEKKFDSKIMKL